MTATLTDAPSTLSDADFTYLEPTASAPRDAALTCKDREPYEIRVSFPGGRLSVCGVGEVPLWLESTANSLEELLWLEPNWDSYGALRVDVQRVRMALELLTNIMQGQTPAPQLVPTNRGGLQMEWHLGGVDLEIEAVEPGRFLVSYEDANRDEEAEWEQDLGSDWVRVSDVLAQISCRRSD